MAHQDSPHLTTLRDFLWVLKYGEIKCRLDAIGRFAETAYSIGLERTTEELLPCLQILISQSEDLDCLKSLLDQMEILAPFLAGSFCVHQLLSSFENLLKSEEETVQNRSIDCLKLYSKDVNAASFEIHFKPQLHRLTTDNCVSTRRLVCRLYSAYYPRLPFALKEDLLIDYGNLCRDSADCVRESAAYHLGEFCKVVDFERLRSVVIPLYVSLTQDEMDFVRIASVDAFIGICGKLIPRNVEQLLLPIFMKLVDDKSYRVRLKMATSIIDIQRAVGPGMSKTHLIQMLSKFLNDPVTDVRIAIIKRTPEFCNNLEVIARESLSVLLMPQLEGFCCDPSQEVRATVCDLIKLAPFLSLERTKQYIVPATLALLRDDCYTVQFKAASNLSYLKNAMDVYVLSNSFTAEMLVAVKLNKLEKLVKLIDSLPLYAAGFGEDFVDEKMIENVILTEANHSNILVKASILNSMRKTVETLGMTWVERLLFHQISSMLERKNQSYDKRCCDWIHVTLSGLPAAVVNRKVLGYLDQLNEREIDRSELRSTVFHAVKRVKNTVEKEILDVTMATLEGTLFRNSDDKEYLQLALSDSEPTLPSKENGNMLSIFKELPKVDDGVVLRRNRTIAKTDVLSDDSRWKRLSLPATPLFEEGTNFDFTLPPTSVARNRLSQTVESLLTSAPRRSRRSLNIPSSWSLSTNGASDINLNSESQVESADRETVSVDTIKEEVNCKNESESDENEPFEVIEASEIINNNIKENNEAIVQEIELNTTGRPSDLPTTSPDTDQMPPSILPNFAEHTQLTLEEESETVHNSESSLVDEDNFQVSHPSDEFDIPASVEQIQSQISNAIEVDNESCVINTSFDLTDMTDNRIDIQEMNVTQTESSTFESEIQMNQSEVIVEKVISEHNHVRFNDNVVEVLITTDTTSPYIDDVIVETTSVSDEDEEDSSTDEGEESVMATYSTNEAEDEQFHDAEDLSGDDAFDDTVQNDNFTDTLTGEFKMNQQLIDFSDDEVDV